MEDAKQHVLSAGCPTACLTVAKCNAPALALYRKTAFTWREDCDEPEGHEIWHLKFAPPSVRLQIQSWRDNSCYIDAVLVVWEAVQRALLRLHVVECIGKATALPPLLRRDAWRGEHIAQQRNFDLTREVEALPCQLNTISVEADMAGPLGRWWSARQQLYNACAPALGADELKYLVSQLCVERNNLRRAYHYSQVTGSSRDEVDANVLSKMQAFGGAYGVLLHLLKPMRQHFLRKQPRSQCAKCSTSNSLEFDGQVNIFISPSEILDASGDVFKALLNHLAPTCCQVCGMEKVVAHTRVAESETPGFICCELEDRPSELLHDIYQLRAMDNRELRIGGQTYGVYRLHSVLLYTPGGHFIADVYDDREQSWIRCVHRCNI